MAAQKNGLAQPKGREAKAAARLEIAIKMRAANDARGDDRLDGGKQHSEQQHTAPGTQEPSADARTSSQRNRRRGSEPKSRPAAIRQQHVRPRDEQRGRTEVNEHHTPGIENAGHDHQPLLQPQQPALQRAAGRPNARWAFFFCFRDTAGRCAGRRGATQGGWGARKKGRAGLGRACRVGSRWPCGCCLVAQEGLM